MSDKLMPCPFCGHKPKIEKSVHIDDTWCFKHQCKEGSRLTTVEGYLYGTRGAAIHDWNRRAERTGRWISYEDDICDTVYKCSECKEEYCLIEGTPQDNIYNYCPSCGAHMIGGEEHAD